MSIHTELPIYRTGVQLLALAVKAQQQMPRGVKRSLGVSGLVERREELNG